MKTLYVALPAHGEDAPEYLGTFLSLRALDRWAQLRALSDQEGVYGISLIHNVTAHDEDAVVEGPGAREVPGDAPFSVLTDQPDVDEEHRLELGEAYVHSMGVTLKAVIKHTDSQVYTDDLSWAQLDVLRAELGAA